jgi:DNA ligase-1
MNELERLLNNTRSKDFLMLAHVWDKKRFVGGWFVSEKLDGMRALWDGGISKGISVNKVPWADVQSNDTRISTGLWSRLRKPIMCPDWWSAQLPRIPLDGELWMGPGTFQKLMTIARKLNPDDRWKDVQYKVFDSPPVDYICFPRHPKDLGWEGEGWDCIVRLRNYEETQDLLRDKVPGLLIKQTQLPRVGYQEMLEKLLTMTIENGGEGLMLRNPVTPWVAKRSLNLLKYKPFEDAECIVKGYIWGDGKYEGKLGCLQVEWTDGLKRIICFELSGMTDDERILERFKEGAEIGKPKTEVNQHEWFSMAFPIGESITFRYRTLSDDGVPKEARYKRKAAPTLE